MDRNQELHELSQPLTRLQWRLELAGTTGDPELQKTIAAALSDVGELIERVRLMRSGTEARPKTVGRVA